MAHSGPDDRGVWPQHCAGCQAWLGHTPAGSQAPGVFCWASGGDAPGRPGSHDPSVIWALPLGFSLKHPSLRCRSHWKLFGRSQMQEGRERPLAGSPFLLLHLGALSDTRTHTHTRTLGCK